MSQHQKELHIAPMMGVTTREFRALMRILSKHVILWTEMQVAETLVHSQDALDRLGDAELERPIICQIGGSNHEIACQATKMIVERGFDGVNLNCGCPSNRVATKQEFGSALMKKHDVAFNVLQRMQEAVDTTETSISVKTRIGVDDCDSLDFMITFLERLRPNCKRFFLHARKVHMHGIIPAQNRHIPPLNYVRVYELCNHFPDCDYWINGGVLDLHEAIQIVYGCAETTNIREHAVPCHVCKLPFGSCKAVSSPVPTNLKGVMMGRSAMNDPCIFADADRYFYGQRSNPCINRRQVLNRYCSFLETVYPRRCSDNDDRITRDMPAPDVKAHGFCVHCRALYMGNKELLEETPPDYNNEPELDNVDCIKITSFILDRSFKPILGIFMNQPSSKQFRRSLDRLSRDLVLRNCGPGALLRLAIKDVPVNVLEKPFV
jgi:tRNA-dihydrouridine synthase A